MTLPRRPGPLGRIAAFCGRFLAPVQRRFELLLLAASIPLALLAGFVAWQNYGFQIDRAYDRAQSELHAATAAIAAVRASARRSGATLPASYIHDAATQRSAPGLRIWSVDATGAKALTDNTSGALPASDTLAGLLDGAQFRRARLAADGQPYTYAAAAIEPGNWLVVGWPAAGDLAAAQEVLARRIVELGLLLLAGLAAVAFGARQLVVAPISNLSSAVRRWRSGGIFAPALGSDVPVEIRELAASFTEATSALTERESQLRRAVTQQDLLMQEIHHRVKNNLQIIASLLNLQASRIRQPQARAEFETARDRIRALATLHRHLYVDGELHTINMREFLTELCDQLVQAIGDKVDDTVGASRERVSVSIEAQELRISSDQAVPIALIVTEAVSNAAKYAFPDGMRGRIGVELTVMEQDRAQLIIEDDGIGIPDGPAETEMGKRDGLGIQLIRGFARQLGASLTVTHEHGTRYTLDLPLRTERQA